MEVIEFDPSHAPGFDYEQYERDCPRPACDGHVSFHFSRVHKGTHGSYIDEAYSLDIICKCRGCGHLDTAQPPLSEEQYQTFTEHYAGEEFFLPWSPHSGDGQTEIDDVYDDDEAELIRERLDSLGYI